MRLESFLNELKSAGWEDADEYHEEICRLWRLMFPELAQVEGELEDPEVALIASIKALLERAP